MSGSSILVAVNALALEPLEHAGTAAENNWGDRELDLIDEARGQVLV